jgi:hypothetical protein
MKCSKIEECRLVSLPEVHSIYGRLTSVSSNCEVLFDINRVYYLYDVPAGEERGGHAHKGLKQLIVAASGSFDDDGSSRATFSLNRPTIGLAMPPGIWREISNFSSCSVCLVLASEVYLESDYIRDYNEFLKYKNK